MAEGQSNAKPQEPILNVVEEQIALTYAEGFMGALGDSTDESVNELEQLNAEVLTKYPRLLEALGSAFLDHDQRVAMIDRIFGGKVNDTVLRLMKVLSAHGRIDILPSVARQARKLHNEANNRQEVVVRLAHEVDDNLMSEIEKVIRERTGIEPVIRIEIDPSLIGGLEVRVGDTVFDGSLRTAFDRSHKAIVNQTVEAIETQPERFTLAS